jgi:hypothetical protein
MRTALLAAAIGVVALLAGPVVAGSYTALPAWLVPIASDMQAAPSADAAFSALARGQVIDPENPQLLNSFVQAMVRLDSPADAYEQARQLTLAEPRNGLAWSVVAYTQNKLGLHEDALASAAQAAKHAPNDPFAMKVRGEVAAWFDGQAVNGHSSPTVAGLLADVETGALGRQDYEQSFTAARDVYENQTAAARAAQAAATKPAPAMVSACTTSEGVNTYYSATEVAATLARGEGVYPIDPTAQYPEIANRLNDYVSRAQANDWASPPAFALIDSGGGGGLAVAMSTPGGAAFTRQFAAQPVGSTPIPMSPQAYRAAASVTPAASASSASGSAVATNAAGPVAASPGGLLMVNGPTNRPLSILASPGRSGGGMTFHASNGVRLAGGRRGR